MENLALRQQVTAPKGNGVCPGCGLGRQNGQGIVDGVDSGTTKWETAHSHDTGH